MLGGIAIPFLWYPLFHFVVVPSMAPEFLNMGLAFLYLGGLAWACILTAIVELISCAASMVVLTRTQMSRKPLNVCILIVGLIALVYASVVAISLVFH